MRPHECSRCPFLTRCCCVSVFLYSVGEARLARLRHDSELAEAADKAERRKIELNSLSSITPSTNTTSTDQSTITPPAPQSQTPQ